MKTVNWIATLVLVASMWGCGGGGGNPGTSPFDPSPSASAPEPGTVATSVDVLASTTQLGSGAGTATITAVVTGAGGASLPGVAVRFAADSGVLTNVDAVTNESGIATAELGAGANKSNRDITVNVTSGSATGLVRVGVTGTTLSFAGDSTISLGNSRTLTVTANDSRGVPIRDLTITASSSLGNTLSTATFTTDAQGSAPVSYTAVRAGSDVLTFTGGGVTMTARIEISGEDFVFVSPAANTQVDVGIPQLLTVRYRQNSAPQAGRTVNFAVTAGALNASSAVTNASGEASVSVTATSASPATVQADLVGGAAARATLSLRFVARTPNRLVLQVSPTAIGPNLSGSTTQQARLTATVSDVNGNPVAGQAVNFNRTFDPSGGNLSQASSTTDSSGQATVQYIAGPQTTSSNGVQITATVAGTAVSGSASLTVNQSALFIALGTGNEIQNLDPQTYKKDWVVYVTDANGIVVPGVELTMKVLPVHYRKGTLSLYGPPTIWSYTDAVPTTCVNEDLNYNGQLDPGEDTNGSGVLEPGNVISVSPGIVRTDTNGRATVSLIYAESLVPWVRVVLRAEAVVAGTESSREAVFWVTGVASDFTSSTVTPAGATSPYGVASCAVPN